MDEGDVCTSKQFTNYQDSLKKLSVLLFCCCGKMTWGEKFEKRGFDFQFLEIHSITVRKADMKART